MWAHPGLIYCCNPRGLPVDVSPEQCQGIFSVSAKVLVRQIGCLMSVELNEAFFAKIAGWQAMKEARGLLATEKVLSSNWSPPVLKGVVQEGTTSYRAGLVIKDPINIENLCGCRPSREWGTICAHSVGVGLHHLNQKASEARAQTAARSESTGKSRPSAGARSAPQRLQRNASGEPAELHIILPPNFEQAAVRGKVMLC